jgi:hypothetical protein
MGPAPAFSQNHPLPDGSQLKRGLFICVKVLPVAIESNSIDVLACLACVLEKVFASAEKTEHADDNN